MRQGPADAQPPVATDGAEQQQRGARDLPFRDIVMLPRRYSVSSAALAGGSSITYRPFVGRSSVADVGAGRRPSSSRAEARAAERDPDLGGDAGARKQLERGGTGGRDGDGDGWGWLRSLLMTTTRTWPSVALVAQTFNPATRGDVVCSNRDAGGRGLRERHQPVVDRMDVALPDATDVCEAEQLVDRVRARCGC